MIIRNATFQNLCVKQHTLAIIVPQNWETSIYSDTTGPIIGYNECLNPQEVCPREEQNMKTGEGYHLCKEVCQQTGHAEANACKAAGSRAKGSFLILIGHTYCCDECIRTMEEYGVEQVFIMDSNVTLKTQH